MRTRLTRRSAESTSKLVGDMNIAMKKVNMDAPMSMCKAALLLNACKSAMTML
jgi:hypothetical protein